jgi:hypothetical protein
MTDEQAPGAQPPRAAGTRAPERLVAGLDSAGVTQAAKAFREIDTTTRVYVRQWLIVGRHADEATACETLAKTFEGRLLPDDMRVDLDETDNSWLALTRRWTVAGEWNSPDLATSHAARIEAGEDSAFQTTPDIETRLVTLNSRAEHELKNYGTLKLPAAPTATP